MALRMTEEEWRKFHGELAGDAEKAAEPKKRPKYGNRATCVCGLKFDSKHEAEIYRELMLRVRAGEIK